MLMGTAGGLEVTGIKRENSLKVEGSQLRLEGLNGGITGDGFSSTLGTKARGPHLTRIGELTGLSGGYQTAAGSTSTRSSGPEQAPRRSTRASKLLGKGAGVSWSGWRV